MNHEVLSLDIPSADGNAGVSKDIRDLREACVFIHGGGTFSFKVQVKVSGKAAPAVVPAGNPSHTVPPTTAKPAADVPTAADNNDDWFDLKTAIVATAVVPIADQTSGAPLAVTHVRIFRTSGDNAQKASVAGRNSRGT